MSLLSWCVYIVELLSLEELVQRLEELEISEYRHIIKMNCVYFMLIFSIFFFILKRNFWNSRTFRSQQELNRNRNE